MLKKIVASLVFLLAIGLAGTGMAATEPAGALDDINRAIDEADSKAFQQLVDIDGILADSLNAFLRELKNPETASKLPPLLALMFSQAAAQSEGGETLRGLLRSEARNFVLNGIESGAFAGRKPIVANSQNLFGPIFSAASPGRKAVIGTGKPTKSGNMWLMPFTVHDYGNERDYNVKGRFTRQNDGTVRLTGIENIPALLAQIGAENAE